MQQLLLLLASVPAALVVVAHLQPAGEDREIFLYQLGFEWPSTLQLRLVFLLVLVAERLPFPGLCFFPALAPSFFMSSSEHRGAKIWSEQIGQSEKQLFIA